MTHRDTMVNVNRLIENGHGWPLPGEVKLIPFAISGGAIGNGFTLRTT